MRCQLPQCQPPDPKMWGAITKTGLLNGELWRHPFLDYMPLAIFECWFRKSPQYFGVYCPSWWFKFLNILITGQASSSIKTARSRTQVFYPHSMYFGMMHMRGSSLPMAHHMIGQMHEFLLIYLQGFTHKNGTLLRKLDIAALRETCCFCLRSPGGVRVSFPNICQVYFACFFFFVCFWQDLIR